MLRRTFLKAFAGVVAAASVPLRAVLPENRLPTWAAHNATIIRTELNLSAHTATITARLDDGREVTFGMGAGGYELEPGQRTKISHYAL